MSYFDQHKNLAASLVVAPPSPATSGTSLTISPGQGALFPSAPFNCTVCPANAIPTQATAEIVRVTAIVGDTFTVVRAQEGTTAKALAAGFFIANSITVLDITTIENAICVFVTPPPATPTSTGIHPSMSVDSGFAYFTISTNAWRRTALSSWTATQNNIVTFGGTQIDTFAGDDLVTLS